MLKSYQNNDIYKSLKELWKQISEFKSFYYNENGDNSLFNSKSKRKKLWISFSDEEEIENIVKSEAFKINTRSVLGVKNNNDWIYGLNIGNIMHLTPLLFNELKADVEWSESEDLVAKELSNHNTLEKVTYLASAYFCIATELRFLHKKISDRKYPK